MAHLPEELLRNTFAEFDQDGNGSLSPSELKPMLELVAARHNLKLLKNQIKEICEVSKCFNNWLITHLSIGL